MFIKDYFEKSKQNHMKVLVHFKDQPQSEPATDYDEIDAIFDGNGNLVGYLITTDGLGDFYPKEEINWIGIQEIAEW